MRDSSAGDESTGWSVTGADTAVSRPVSAQYGRCSVTMLPRHREVVVSANGSVLVLSESTAWQLADALADVRAQADGAP